MSNLARDCSDIVHLLGHVPIHQTYVDGKINVVPARTASISFWVLP